MNKSVQTDCDECGKCDVKTHRIYNGHRYCSTCYARNFKQRYCPKCHEVKRLPTSNPDAICTKCQRSKPCTRCGRLKFPIGLMTLYGPVCNSCSPHFRVAKACESCGQLSSELSKVHRLDGELRLCRKCQHRDYETCPRCRRYRLLTTSDGSGERVCKLCVDDKDVACTICGKSMPGGRVSRCEDCYWREAAIKKISINAHCFMLPAMAISFNDFGTWLIRECGAKNAALSVHRYVSFFVDVERIWGEFPSYAILVSHFKAEGLRRVRRPMRWLSEMHAVRVDCEVREKTSDEDRIARALMTLAPDAIGANAITGYERSLRIRLHEGKTSLRSIRLALTPALNLLQAVGKTQNSLPDQQTLNRYLLEKPGQRAALTGFINYLKAHFSLHLEMKTDQVVTKRMRRKKLESILSRIILTNGLTLENFDKWVTVALEYFHEVKIPKRNITSLRASVRSIDSLGIDVVIESRSYYLPIYSKSSDIAF